MALSTKGVKVGGNLPKTLSPGNVLAKVNGLSVKEDIRKPGALYVQLHLEGVDLTDGGFEGFFIDKDDESKGRHKGQVGTVQHSSFAFEDKEINGKEINRDQSILQFCKLLAKELGKEAELDVVEADTIEEFVAKASDAIKGDTFIYFCLGGNEYEKGGYVKHALQLAKSDFKARKYNFSASEENVVKYDESKHLYKKKKSETTSDFEPSQTDEFVI